MNAHDLYSSLVSMNRFLSSNFSFVLDGKNKLIGFLTCDKDFIPITISDYVFNDIINNNTSYKKCVYASGQTFRGVKSNNALKGLSSIDTSDRQSYLTPIVINNTRYYRAAGMLLDADYNILLCLCYDSNHKIKLVVSSSVYCGKITLYKYIVQKLIPIFAKNGLEITIKNKKIELFDNIELDYFSNLKDMKNEYELVKMGD